MAESTSEPPPNRFFCHQCLQEITPKIPEYMCPQCESGFIEEIIAPDQTDGRETVEDDDDDQYEDVDDYDPQARFQEGPGVVFGPLDSLWGHTFLESFRAAAAPVTIGQHSDEASTSGEGGASNAGPDFVRAAESVALPAGGPRRPRHYRIQHRVQTGGGRHLLEPTINTILNHLLTGLMGNQQGAMGAFIGNPGDYAWGPGGLDNVITQLLNQMEGQGAPPAEPEKIESIPVVKVTEKQVEENMQCSVCLCDFSLGEEVRKLPCEHSYHNDCIIPWLERHGTCPVCRKDLNGEIPDTQDTPLNFDDLVRATQQGQSSSHDDSERQDER